MNKSQYVLRSILAVIAIFSFVFIFAGGVYAASTIGTNMSTTGTFTQTVGSATAAQFQNAAGTVNTLTVDTTNNRVGVFTASPTTTFEVQGTASASYFLTGNTIQVGGLASVAYNRFGTVATTHALSASNDVLINGILEVDGKTFLDGTASVSSNFEVGGTASVSGVFYLTNGQIRPGTGGDSTTAFRFQNAAGTTTVLTIDTTKWRVGIGGTPATTFEVQGTASASYFLTGNTIQVGGLASVAYNRFGTVATTHALSASNDVLINGILEVDGKTFLDGTASVAGAFEAVGYASASQGFFTNDLVVGNNTASSSTIYSAEFGGGSNTGTVSLLFGGSAASTKGTCLQLKDSVGNWAYARVLGGATSITVSTTKCHN